MVAEATTTTYRFGHNLYETLELRCEGGGDGGRERGRETEGNRGKGRRNETNALLQNQTCISLCHTHTPALNPPSLRPSLRYGHTSQLLLLGVPSAYFRVARASQEVALVDLSRDTDDEEEGENHDNNKQSKKRKASAAVKKEGGRGGAAKRVKAEMVDLS